MFRNVKKVTKMTWCDAFATIGIYLSTCNLIASTPPPTYLPKHPNHLSAVSLQHECEQPVCRQLYHQTLRQTHSPCSALPIGDRQSGNEARARDGCDEERVAERESTREFQPQFFSAWGGQFALPSEEIYLKEKTSHYTPANERAEIGRKSFLPSLLFLQERQREIILAFYVVGVLPNQPKGGCWLHIVC